MFVSSFQSNNLKIVLGSNYRGDLKRFAECMIQSKLNVHKLLKLTEIGKIKYRRYRR